MAKSMGTEHSKIRHQTVVTYKAFLIACSDATKIVEVVVSSDNVNRLYSKSNRQLENKYDEL